MSNVGWKFGIGALVCLGLLSAPQRISAQNITNWLPVDCSGESTVTDPSIYPSISAALQNATHGTGIYLMTNYPCSEWVTIANLRDIVLSGYWDGGSTLTGALNIEKSDWVYVNNLTVSASPWRGMYVNNSQNVMFDGCSSINNGGPGLRIGGASSVAIQGFGTFSFNAQDGIDTELNSTLSLFASAGPIDISSNGGRGLYIDRSTFVSQGNVSITNNAGAYGLEMLGHSTGLMWAYNGPHTISANLNGGVHVAEESQLSFGGGLQSAPYPNIIQGNGPVGILAESAGQVSLAGAQVLDHTVAGIDVYGNSQLKLYWGINQIMHNGFGTEPLRAGIRIDQNSQAYVRGAEITQNGGPGILDLVNSTVDVAGSTFSSNAGGPVVCDGTAFVVSDLPTAALGPTNSCKAAGASGARRRFAAPQFNVPDWKEQKALSEKLRAMIPRSPR